MSFKEDGSPFLRFGGLGILTRSLTLKYVITKSKLPIIDATKAIDIYFVFSSASPESPVRDGSTKPSIINMAMGTAEPIPFVVLAIDSILPRSEGFGVIAFGRLQNGTSDIVYIIPHKTYVTDAYIIFAVIEISGA